MGSYFRLPISMKYRKSSIIFFLHNTLLLGLNDNMILSVLCRNIRKLLEHIVINSQIPLMSNAGEILNFYSFHSHVINEIMLIT